VFIIHTAALEKLNSLYFLFCVVFHPNNYYVNQSKQLSFSADVTEAVHYYNVNQYMVIISHCFTINVVGNEALLKFR